MPRLALVLIDGLGDVNIPDLGNLTPLQAADTPALDAIAASGLNGLLDPVEPGLACGSDTAHLSLFGYDPRIHYRGRGAFESMGAGIPMEPGDIAFKSNFATIDEDTGVVLSRRADRVFDELGPVLCEAVNGIKLPSFPEHAVRVQYATEHRCGVVVSGPLLSDCISGTDPLKDNLPLLVAEPLETSPEAKCTASLVNELSDAMRQILRAHPVNKQRKAEGKPPANIILLRGCGSRIKVQSFQERYNLKACMVAPTKIIAGLGMSLGVKVLNVPEATGDYKTAFHAKARAIAEALIHGESDFGFLHVKAVDDTGHDRAITMKVRYLEAVDKMVMQLIARLALAESDGKGKFIILVTGDHSTPAVFGDHSHEPVPFSVAHLRNIVDSLGGLQQMRDVSLEHIPHPASPDAQPSLLHMGQQALHRRAALRNLLKSTHGDRVCMFDELSAAKGSLGRFPGSQVMPLICSLVAA